MIIPPLPEPPEKVMAGAMYYKVEGIDSLGPWMPPCEVLDQIGHADEQDEQSEVFMWTECVIDSGGVWPQPAGERTRKA